MAEILGGKPVTSFGSISVSPSTSLVISTVDLSNFNSCNWTIIIKDDTNNKTKFSNIVAILKDATSISNTEVVQGDKLNCVIDVSINTGNIELTITNNEAISLAIDLVTTKF